MGVEGFVCWTAQSVEDRAELRRVLNAQLSSGTRALRQARESGLVDGTTLRPAGLAAAQAFAERSELPMPGPAAAIADFGALLDALDRVAATGRNSPPRASRPSSTTSRRRWIGSTASTTRSTWRGRTPTGRRWNSTTGRGTRVTPARRNPTGRVRSSGCAATSTDREHRVEWIED
ncbi:hypothetical protein ACFQL0_09480 [Haloplanus litoreus]|uniref:hypothetical protein n=1 Tax=Haloplanus litoreus TaxID=767515 RepID=UPI00360B3DEF